MNHASLACGDLALYALHLLQEEAFRNGDRMCTASDERDGYGRVDGAFASVPLEVDDKAVPAGARQRFLNAVAREPHPQAAP